MDGIIHAPNKYVLCLGKFVDEAPYTHRYDWVRVYWRSTGTRIEDYLRTPDYFFRYDRGVTNVHPRSFVGRLLFGKVMSSTTLLRLAEVLHRFLSADRPNVTVDLFLPIAKLQDFMQWYRGAIDYFPLWCVPYRRVRYYEWIAPGYFDGIDDELFVDLAIYGLEQPRGRNYYKEIEDELPKVRGIKTLISHNFYDEETFWTIWNKAQLRRREGDHGSEEHPSRPLHEDVSRGARAVTAARAARVRPSVVGRGPRAARLRTTTLSSSPASRARAETTSCRPSRLARGRSASRSTPASAAARKSALRSREAGSQRAASSSGPAPPLVCGPCSRPRPAR